MIVDTSLTAKIDNLEATMSNLGRLNQLWFKEFLRVSVYNLFEIARERALEIIATGEGMEPNVGKYAINWTSFRP